MVFLTLLLVTPVCGVLFGCGCDWPWNHLFFDCDSLRGIRPACPWCEMPVLGIASVGLPILGGIGFIRAGRLLSCRKNGFPAFSPPAAIALTLLLGGLGIAAGFVLAAMLTPAIGPG